MLLFSLMYQSVNLFLKSCSLNDGSVSAYFCGGGNINLPLQFRSSFKVGLLPSKKFFLFASMKALLK